MGQGQRYNGTGAQWDGRDGARDTMGLGHNGTELGIQWDWGTVGRKGTGLGTQWDWGTMGQEYKNRGTMGRG